MTQTLPIPVPIADAGLATYIQTLNAQPVLSAEEEHALALRYHREGDLEAARLLVLSHLRYVVRIARQFTGYGLPQADLIQEGRQAFRSDARRASRIVCRSLDSRTNL